jgi:hypothetical protein
MKKLIILLSFISFIGWTANAQNEKFKALFIYNFTKHVEWNANKKSRDFIIAVYGSPELYASLKMIADTKTVGKQNIKVIKVNSPDEIDDCHIFYVAPTKANKVEDIKSHFRSKQVLIIGDKPGLIKAGAGINLVTVDGKQKFEISKTNIEERGLDVSNALLSLGISL